MGNPGFGNEVGPVAMTASVAAVTGGMAVMAVPPLALLALENPATATTCAIVVGDAAAGIAAGVASPNSIVSSAQVGKIVAVEQYALRAASSGFFPVVTRGFPKPNALTWLNRGDVWKFGTTKNPATRYSERYLLGNGNGLRYTTEFTGNLDEARALQNMKIQNYVEQTGYLPPGNKIVN